MLIQILICLFCLCAPPAATAQRGPGIDKILAELPRSTAVSVSIYDTGSREFIYTHNPELPLKPASNIKIAPGTAALFHLGAGYKIHTSLHYYKSALKNGILKESLYFKGAGDPSLSIERLNILARMIKDKGVKRIEGNIIFDNSFFPMKKSRRTFLYNPSPIELPAISPVSINNNIISVHMDRQGNLSSSIKSKYVEVKKISSGKQEITETEKGIKIFIIPSLLKKNKNEIHFFLKNPPLLASLLLKEKLEENGVQVKGTCTAGTVAAGMEIVSTSVNLIDIIKEINSSSNNYYAETLFETLLKVLPSPNGKQTGGERIVNYLRSINFDTKGMHIADGSGISPDNRITSSSLVGLLRQIKESSNRFDAFSRTLAEAGISGTLKERFINSPLKGKFIGKSGFMAGVASLSGYLVSEKGRNYIISVIFNFKEKDILYYQGIEKRILELVYSIK